ncbi:disulfide bond formation protein B [Acetobacter sp. DsW_063]|uniref:disulfide bond formation protein B n=1 Tax=Acetobacter sp. DsW_063 TaxID=1514894 RepID=UPI000A3AB5F4|nr:disulfide bond formation protein B [Acetobacter sp. DsW_063]
MLTPKRRIFRRHVPGLVRPPGFLLALSGVTAMLTVWWMQDVLGVVPCGLCLWERWPWRAMILIGLAALLAPRRLARGVAWIGVAPVLTAVALAGLHLGVEWRFWPSPLPECQAPHFQVGSISQRLASMPMHPSKPCDLPTYPFDWLPISLVEFEGLAALLVLGLLLASLLFKDDGGVRKSDSRQTIRER